MRNENRQTPMVDEAFLIINQKNNNNNHYHYDAIKRIMRKCSGKKGNACLGRDNASMDVRVGYPRSGCRGGVLT